MNSTNEPYGMHGHAHTYRADVNGLRAFAVLAVIFCHAKFRWFAGGFVGVDVFFVISGFVVASSISRHLAMGTFALGEFYLQRARRLIPALCLMLAAVLAFCLLCRVPSDAYDAAKNIGYVAIMASNDYLSRGWSYFDAKAVDQPLLHTWSLSVEEQFYLLLPVALYYLLRRGRVVAGIVLSTAFVASLIASELHVRQGASGSYYLFHNRAFELLLGVLLSLARGQGAGATRRVSFDVLLLVGLGVIGWSVVKFSDATPFPGLNALIPCLSTVIVIVAGERARYTHKLLDNPLASAIGVLSYSLYLWHWPVFFAMRTFGRAAPVDFIVGIAIAFALSIGTYFLVERPLRFRPMPKRRAVVGFVIAPLLFAGSVVAVGKTTDDFLFAYPAQAKRDYALAGRAVFDLPRAKQCWEQVQATSDEQCSVGTVGSTDKAALWGDSHAYQMISFFDQLGKAYGLSIHDLDFAMCPPIETMPPLPGDKTLLQAHLECGKHDTAVMAYLLDHPEIRTVFMSAVWQIYANEGQDPDVTPQVHGFMPGQIDAALDDTIRKLQKAGKRIVLLDDVPSIPEDLINCQFYNDVWLPQRRDCHFKTAIAQQDHATARRMLDRITRTFPGVRVIHTYDVPCGPQRCTLELDGAPLYRYGDYGHLGIAGSDVYFGAYVKKHPTELSDVLGHPPVAQPPKLAPSSRG